MIIFLFKGLSYLKSSILGIGSVKGIFAYIALVLKSSVELLKLVKQKIKEMASAPPRKL